VCVCVRFRVNRKPLAPRALRALVATRQPTKRSRPGPFVRPDVYEPPVPEKIKRRPRPVFFARDDKSILFTTAS